MSFLSRLNVFPQFPAYKGPYTVASFELEIPVSSLPTAQKPPKSAESISTVQFRVFYPTGQHFTPADPKNTTATPPSGETAGAEAKGWTSGWFRQRHPCSRPSKSVYWLPEPHQREYLSGYARFLGAGSGLAELISYIPRILHHIALPAISQAPLLPSDSDFKFPTVIFSHGLGGTRLAYSHLCGSLASYGNIVIVPEHRDGSAPVTFIKPGSSNETEVKGLKPDSGEPGISSSSAAPSPSRIQVDYTNYPHQISEETADGRNRQLEIRLWELSVLYVALTQLDLGYIPAGTSMLDADTASRDSLLSAFREKFDIREPGRLIWIGHSFGSATMIQMMKSVYYGKRGLISDSEAPLFVPDTTVPHKSPGAVPLGEQITASSPLMLLDIWCLPLLSKRTRPLWKLPLPQVGEGNPDKVLVVMSDAFFCWRENLLGVRRVLSTDPGRRRKGPEQKVFEQWDSRPNTASNEFHPNNDVPTPGGTNTGNQIVPPTETSSAPSPPSENDAKEKEGVRFYYVKESAHLSQSDFGILFPYTMKKAVGPELILDLNVRAACQWLRECGFEGQVAEYNGQKDAGGLDEKLQKMEIGEKGGDDIFGAETERWIRISLEG